MGRAQFQIGHHGAIVSGSLDPLPAKDIVASDREVCAFVIDEDGAATCVFDLEHIDVASLVGARTIARRLPTKRLTIATPHYSLHRLHGPSEIESYFSGLLEGRTCASTRFFQWELSLDERQVPRDLAALVGVYAKGSAHSWHEFLAILKTAKPAARFIAYRHDEATGDYIVESASPSLRDGGTGWFARAAGKALSQVPDHEYAQWTKAAYGDAVALREPFLHRVSIDVWWPDVEPSRQDYVRLVLPFFDPSSGSASLVCVMHDVQLAC